MRGDPLKLTPIKMNMNNYGVKNLHGGELILIVDDDEDMRDTIRVVLELDGYKVIEAADADGMHAMVKEHDISLILLDLVLPGSDGLTIMREFRPTSSIPIVMLTGKGDVIDKIVGLEVGADDYITKPFHARELTARIRSVLRRNTFVEAVSQPEVCKVDEKDSHVVSFNDWKLDLYAHTLSDPKGKNVNITGHEFSILQVLVESAGRVLSRDQLLDHMSVGEREWSPFDRSLDVLVAKVRKKLGDSAKMPTFIRTIRQSGYMFIAEVKKL